MSCATNAFQAWRWEEGVMGGMCAWYFFLQIVLTAFVVVWGMRLAIFLLLRILAWGKDQRFDDKRDNLLKFALFWLFQVGSSSWMLHLFFHDYLWHRGP
jgi:steroid 5-alpha reductase family enzyme